MSNLFKFECILIRNNDKNPHFLSQTEIHLAKVKESFSNMSAPMFSQENARCAVLPISSLLATLRYDTGFVKLPLALKSCLWGHAATQGTLFNEEKCQFLCVSPH